MTKIDFSIIKNKISDPLKELNSDLFTKFQNTFTSLNHHSPSSALLPEGFYVFSRIICNQQMRRGFEINSNMKAGVAINDIVQFVYADTMWSFHPNLKKLAPHKNIKLSKDEAIAKAMETFKEYEPCDDKDREKKEHFLETIPQTAQQAFNAFESIGILTGKNIIAEDSINFQDDRLVLPLVGRSDVSFQNKIQFADFNASERSVAASSSNDAPFLSICELKTSWARPGKIKKCGNRSFSSPRLVTSPSRPHLQQLSFYHHVLKAKHKLVYPFLIYAVADGFKVFTKDNCGDLETANLNNYFEQLIQKCIRIERLLARHIDLEEPEMIISEIIKDVDPGFDHPFYWKIGYEYLSKAKKIWSNK